MLLPFSHSLRVMTLVSLIVLPSVFVSPLPSQGDDSPVVGQYVDFGIYQDCPVIENESCRVVLCPQVGGRVLEYSLRGINALFVSNYESGRGGDAGKWKKDPSAGRFDIGPEMMMPRRDTLFRGKWSTVWLGKRHVRLISGNCDATGVRLQRDFVLDDSSSRLAITQSIFNVSDHEVRHCHWSRTLANGAGIVVIPMSEHRRFPNAYVRYDQHALAMRPEDPNVRQRDGFLEIIGPPLSPKLGMDSLEGWLAHQQKSGLLFVKKFPTYPDRAYAELAAITISTWTPPNGETVELEPIGPSEKILPNQSASFTETWWLLDSSFPEQGTSLDLDELRSRVEKLSVK